MPKSTSPALSSQIKQTLYVCFQPRQLEANSSIWTQLQSFARLGFSDQLTVFCSENAQAMQRMSQIAPENYCGDKDFQVLEQLCKTLHDLTASIQFNTDEIRKKIAEYRHYLNHSGSALGQKMASLVKELESSGKNLGDDELISHIQIRIGMFAEKFDEILGKQLQCLANKLLTIAEDALTAASLCVAQIEQGDATEPQRAQALMDLQELEAIFDSVYSQATAEDKAYPNTPFHLARLGEIKQAFAPLRERLSLPVTPHSAATPLSPQSPATTPGRAPEEERDEVMVEEGDSHLTGDQLGNQPRVGNLSQPAPMATPADAPAQAQQAAALARKQSRIDNAIRLVERYLSVLQQERSSWWRNLFMFFHRGRKDAKIDYCEKLLTSLREEKERITPATNLHELIEKAHQEAQSQTPARQSRLTLGGSYVGSSRMLALQRQLGVDSAWSCEQGKSAFLFFKTSSDYHGLKTQGMTEANQKTRETIRQFYADAEGVESEYEAVTQSANKKP